jgi:hypothetical protein
MTVVSEQTIRERAYQIWEREGRVHGRHEEHWHSAKLELSAAAREGAQIAIRPAETMAAAKAPAAKKSRARPKAAELPVPAAAAAKRPRRAPARPLQ